MKKILYFLPALLLTTLTEVAGTEDWPVPAEYANLENPVIFNNQNVRAGKDIWDKNCKSCHGDPGRYNALALVPPPPDASSDLMQDHTDGELFFKITYGRGAMPQFETTLSTDDRWKVVTFIRRFDPRNAGLLAEEELLKGKIYALSLERSEMIKKKVLETCPFKDVVICEARGISTVYANSGGIILAF